MAIQTIAVIGAGTMGHGIAQIAAQAGFNVALHDTGEALVGRGLSNIRNNLAKGVERGKVTEAEMRETLARVRRSSGCGRRSRSRGRGDN